MALCMPGVGAAAMTKIRRQGGSSSPGVDRIRAAGPDHQVITLTGADGKRLYRRTPCSDCPWRRDAVGVFPAEAFRHSAHTGYDTTDAVQEWIKGEKPATFSCRDILPALNGRASLRQHEAAPRLRGSQPAWRQCVALRLRLPALPPKVLRRCYV